MTKALPIASWVDRSWIIVPKSCKNTIPLLWKDMSIVVHLLLTFEIYGTFTIPMDDTIQNITEQDNNVSHTQSFASLIV